MNFCILYFHFLWEINFLFFHENDYLEISRLILVGFVLGFFGRTHKTKKCTKSKKTHFSLSKSFVNDSKMESQLIHDRRNGI